MEKLVLSISGTPIQAAGGAPTGGYTTLRGIISVGITILIAGSIVLALIYLVWGGFDWIMSEGEKQRLEQARNKVWFSIIGLVVVFIAFLVINTFFASFLPGTNGCPAPRPGQPPAPC